MRTLGYKLISCLAVFLLPFNVLALGLGEIEVSSFLNQPLRAEIKVISARSGEIDDLLVSLANREAFRRSGLSRPAYLSTLRFSVNKNEDASKATITITTKSAVKEPFLNFLVEADWTKGRVLREFTILLDPPFFAQSAPATSQAETTQTSQTTPIAAPIASQPVSESEAPSAEPTPFVAEEPTTEQTQQSQPDTRDQSAPVGDEMVVEKGNNLWTIARQFKTDESSMAQIMLAIQAVNPDAFNNNNINNLKIGAVIRFPVADEISNFSQQEAYAEVLRQNGLWDDYVARVRGTTAPSQETTAEASTPDSNAVATQEGNLELLTPADDQSSDTASVQAESTDDSSSQLRKQLALAEEEMEAAIIENSELKSRIAQMEAQLEKIAELERVIEIQDDSIASLQANAASDDTSTAVSESIEDETQHVTVEPVVGEAMSTEAMSTDEDPVVAEAAAEEPEIADSADQIAPMVEAEQIEEPEVSMTEESAQVEAVDPMVAETEEVDAPVAPPIIVTEESSEDSLLPSFDELLKDTTVLAGLGALVALILGFVLMRKVRSRKEDESILEGMGVADDETDHLDLEITPVKEELEAKKEDQSEIDDDEIDFSQTAIITSTELPVENPDITEKVTATDDSGSDADDPDQDDVLNEVDVYLAYGLYENAEELLKENLKKEPSRADYRAKLLDTYFATKDADAFVAEASEFKQSGTGVDKYWNRIQTMGYTLAPDNDLFSGAKDSDLSTDDLEYAKPQAADFDLGSDSDDDIIDIGSTDIGFDNTGALDEDNLNLDLDDDIIRTADIDGASDIDLLAELGDGSIEMTELNATAELDAENSSLDFDLPEDLDLGMDDEDIEDSLQLDENSLDFNIDEDISASSDSIEIADVVVDIEPDTKADIETLATATATLEETITATPGDFDSEDDVPDIDMTNFDVDISEIDLDEDLLSESGDEAESDISKVAARTGTFSPGDFENAQEEPAEEPVDEIAIDAGDSEKAESSDELDDISSLMLPDDVDEVSTKLDLAKAFIDMGDLEGAKSSLSEVLQEGSEIQKEEAEALMKQT